jgi:nucleoside-diphosphate-sugar epimerase
MPGRLTGSRADDLIVVTGAGGFIGGWLVRSFVERGARRVRGVDRKPLDEWLQRTPGAECLTLDLTDERNCAIAVAGAREVYNMAADMGGMGFIERFRVECMRSILISVHMLEAAYRAGVERYFFPSSACVYNAALQADPHVRPLREADAYPAMAERGYGWEKLMAEMLCQEYWAERRLRTFIGRLHNIYGPFGTWDGGREKAPAALCRKVIAAVETGAREVSVWGDGTQTRSFTYIEDCLEGIDRIVSCDRLVATPVNLGSSELVTIDRLLDLVESIAGTRLVRRYDTTAPRGVAGRCSDNTFIRSILDWEPGTTLKTGLRQTYAWIEAEYRRRAAVTP